MQREKNRRGRAKKKRRSYVEKRIPPRRKGKQEARIQGILAQKVWGFKVDRNDRLFNLSRVKCLTFSKKCGIISKKNIFSPKAKSIDKRAKMWYNKNRKTIGRC